jgi:MFS superfamily sulfate permease-like transporter
MVTAQIDASEEPPRAVLLDIEATIELDVTTSDALYELAGTLEDLGSQLVIVHAKGMVRDRMRKVGLIERLGPTGMYPSERIAVDALREAWAATSESHETTAATGAAAEATAGPEPPRPDDESATPGG